ncbi:uncharacterized protein LOC124636658 [Helicoverpa zea]|uniref:uncharacterized protein LOC124636658 n=1 Tax=Helicoverpa zea TaxID=7113 RepID=UPI001F59488F|nr:uncharacterized protein LOC124636658 [Helicoverpa zea]
MFSVINHSCLLSRKSLLINSSKRFLQYFAGVGLIMYTHNFRTVFCILCISCFLFGCSNGMTRQQLKNSGKLMKKSCMPKNDVTEEEVGDIEKGKFIESRNVMCYVACIYTMTQVVKNNKLSYEAVIKQVDMMFPAEMRDAVKAAATSCKDITKKYKDLCESAYWTAKCMYDYDAENFMVSQAKHMLHLKLFNINSKILIKYVSVLLSLCEIRCGVTNLQKMQIKQLLGLLVIATCVGIGYGMSRAQVKKTMSLVKNQCMPKNSVTEDQVGKIEEGVFLEDRNVMCYVACIYKNLQVVKNDKLDMSLITKQIDALYPPELKEPVKKAVSLCIHSQDNYNDLCEKVFHASKCLYEKDPASFIFP